MGRVASFGDDVNGDALGTAFPFSRNFASLGWLVGGGGGGGGGRYSTLEVWYGIVWPEVLLGSLASAWGRCGSCPRPPTPARVNRW